MALRIKTRHLDLAPVRVRGRIDTPEAPKAIEQAKPTGSADIDALRRINAAQAQTIAVLMARIKELEAESSEEEEPVRWQFQIKRNADGYLSTVVATAVPDGEPLSNATEILKKGTL